MYSRIGLLLRVLGKSRLSVLISFAVLQEIFKDAFRPYENLRDLSVILFRWSALVVLLVAVMWAINAGHTVDQQRHALPKS